MSDRRDRVRMRLLAGVGVVLCGSPAAAFAANQANIAPAAATRDAGAQAQTRAEPADDAGSDSQVTGNAPVLQTRSGTEPAAEGSDIVVTGSRIVRNGNSAPTPVT
jgi:iron complex outermembrane receptor protein